MSLSVIAAVSAVVIGGTGAFFSDSETSTGNTFTAGAIDLQIDSTAVYNGQPVPSATWALKDLNPTADKFFNFNDVKPGDTGSNSISLHVINNDAWVCAAISNLVDADNTTTEPEDAPDLDNLVSGEMQENLIVTIWRDNGVGGGTPGNNVQDGTEPTIYTGAPQAGTWALYDSTTATGPLTGVTTGYVGVKWTLPLSVGNEVQTDSMTGDISFTVVQSRNNAQFTCGSLISTPQWTEEGTRTGGDVSFVQEEGRGTVLRVETIADNDSRVRWTNNNLNLDLDTLTGISFEANRLAAADLVNGNVSMRLFIDKDGNLLTADVEEITYEPYYNIFAHNALNPASILSNTWQTWSTTLADGKFWGNGGFLGTTPSGGAYATNVTLAQVVAAHANAKIVGISLGMGTWNPSQVVLVDNLIINGSSLSLEN